MRLSPPQRQSGFTLIEALIALVVLSLGLFGLMQIQTRVMTETGDSKTRTAAVNIAQEKLEELRNGSYDSVVSGGDTVQAAAGGTWTFTRSWTVTSKTNPNYKEVSIIASWTSPRQGELGADVEAVTLTTYIAESIPVALDTIGGQSEDDSGDGDEDGDGDGDGDGEDSGPGSCSCFYGQNKNDIKLVASNGSCCSNAYCETNAPDGIKKNESFSVFCPP